MPIPINQSQVMILEGLIKKTGTDKEKFTGLLQSRQARTNDKGNVRTRTINTKKKNTTA